MCGKGEEEDRRLSESAEIQLPVGGYLMNVITGAIEMPSQEVLRVDSAE